MIVTGLVIALLVVLSVFAVVAFMAGTKIVGVAILLVGGWIAVAHFDLYEPGDGLKQNEDYQNGYLSGVTYSGLLDYEAEKRCEDEAIHRYAMVGDDPQGKIDMARFEIGCKDGARGK